MVETVPSETYTKVLVAKHSPEHRCHAADGDVLYVRPRRHVPLKSHVAHHFVSCVDETKKSQYGWVKDTSPFSLESFVRDRIRREVDEDTKLHVQSMLQAIAKLDEGTPVAADYSRRGLEQPRMELNVHRVVFYFK